MSQDPQPNPSSENPTDTLPEEPFTLALPDDPTSGNDWYLWAGVMGLLTMVAFWPAINGSFLWDDDRHVTRNPALMSLRGLLHAWWRPLDTIQYYPLTHTTFWIEHALWGFSPLGYHVMNVVFQAAAAIVLWRVLRRLMIPGAWVAAAVWAVHPLQVESVCWISERKNVLSGFLAFSSLLFYLEFANLREPTAPGRVWRLTSNWQAYAISLLLFILAMLAKSVVCCLAPVLLIILWWKRRLSPRTGWATLPFFVVGAALASVTSYLETSPTGYVRATGPEWQLSLAQKIMISGRDIWFYVGKTFVPINLSFNYPRIVPNPSDLVQWIPAAGVVALVVILALLVRKIGRGPLAAALCYGAAIFPALAFTRVYPFRYSFVWDHFQYLACAVLVTFVIATIAGWIAAVDDRNQKPGRDREEKPTPPPSPLPPVAITPGGALAMTAIDERPPLRRIGVAALSTLLLLALAATSWTRAGVFANNDALWTDVLIKNPGSWFAAYNLSLEMANAAREDMHQAQIALQQDDKDDADAAIKGAFETLDKARVLLHSAIDNPQTPTLTREESYNELASIDLQRLSMPGSDSGKLLSDAQVNAARAIDIDRTFAPDLSDAQPYYTLGEIFQAQSDQIRGELDRASSGRRLPSTTRPATPQEQRCLDLLKSAADAFTRSIQISHQQLSSITVGIEATRLFGMAYYQRANVHFDTAAVQHLRHDVKAESHYFQLAEEDYNIALMIDPSNVVAHYNLGLCLEYFNHLDDAMTQFKAALLAAPQGRYGPAYVESGKVLMMIEPSLENLRIAIQCFRDALEINPNDVNAQRYLGMAERMMATSRPSTRAATLPAERSPNAAPATRP